MQEQLLIQKALLTKLAESKSKNNAFSQRAFAKKVGISSGALSSILSGQRKISPKLASRIIKNLGLGPKEQSRILKSFEADKQLPKLAGLKESKSISLDDFHVISQGIHFSLLSLMETKGFKSEIDWMSARLSKPKREIITALDRLERLGMVVKDKKGNYTTTGESFDAPDEIPSGVIKNAHVDSMEEAKNSLFQDEITIRDFFSGTLAINSSKIPELKKLIREFYREFELLATEGTKDEVYKININFFPMSRG
jgi:uncharacterized protein (TIGR02147 family)